MKTYSMPHLDTPDVWQRLKQEARPLVVWGMGNGADKLIAAFDKHGLEVADFMASDGFVRGQIFHGKEVLSLAKIEEKYPDFVLVVAFASSRPEVMEMLSAAAEKHTLYIPDLPVAGETLFTSAWYGAHYGELLAAADLLADIASRNLFFAILQYKLSGSIEILNDAYTAYRDERAALDPATIHTYIDCGAYTGDTLRELLDNGAPLTSSICVEPDARTYRRLLKYTDTLPAGFVKTIPAAVWSENSVGVFSGSGNRNSSLVGASYEHREERVNLVTVDSLSVGLHVDFIKYDVEGAEREALLGSRETISRCEPRLLVSLYHRTEDLYDLLFLVKELYPSASLRLFRRPCYPAWEIALVACPPTSAE